MSQVKEVRLLQCKNQSSLTKKDVYICCQSHFEYD